MWTNRSSRRVGTPRTADRDADRTQTFHVFASRWWAARKGELRPRTRENYEWRLRKHLLPFFCDYAISEIDVALVERYREHKVIERERVAQAIAAGEPLRDSRGQRRVPLSNESINKTLVTLTQVLDSAVERGLLDSNPARGKRRRLKVVKPVRASSRPTTSRSCSRSPARWTGASTGVTGSVGGR